MVLSPAGSLPALTSLGMPACPALKYVFVQSASLVSLDLSGCAALAKVVLQCPKLGTLQVKGCGGLASILLWSDLLTQIDLGDSQVGGACCLSARLPAVVLTTHIAASRRCSART